MIRKLLTPLTLLCALIMAVGVLAVSALADPRTLLVTLADGRALQIQAEVPAGTPIEQAVPAMDVPVVGVQDVTPPVGATPAPALAPAAEATPGAGQAPASAGGRPGGDGQADEGGLAHDDEASKPRPKVDGRATRGDARPGPRPRRSAP
ncbi:MAG: hypothetical protein H0U79_08750, partial [Solirubrobacterales bacterium]|nr:hypothetical protein [Solirubrobacterales bacterium]